VVRTIASGELDVSNDRELEGRVIRIPDKYSVIIDVGSRDGVKKGMKFKIYEISESILTPEGEDLGRLEYIKAIVQVTQVQERFCIARNTEREDATSTIFSVTKALTHQKTASLPVTSKDIQPFPSLNSIIKIGDRATALEAMGKQVE
jgi:hypothetical protein